MIPGTLSDILKDKLVQIVEGAAFMFVDDDAVPLPTATAGIEVRLEFTGVRAGAFWLAMSEEDSNRLAACMLGRPLERTRGVEVAAPAEFLNILASWVLEALWGGELEYQVSTPKVSALPLEQSVAWSIPAEQRAIVRTDAGCTLVCGIVWGEDA